MPYYLLGSVSALIGGVLLHFANLARSNHYLIGVSVFVALGAGSYAQTSIAVAQRKAGPGLVQAATQVTGIAQVGGINIALVCSNSIFINLAADGIGNVLPTLPRKTIVNAVSGAGSTIFAQLSAKERIAVLKEIVSATQRVYYLVIVGAACAIILSLTMKWEYLPESQEEQNRIEEDGSRKGDTEL